MSTLTFPEHAVPRRPSRRAPDAVSRALEQAERDIQALHVELEVAVERMQVEHPELAVWITTAVWLLEIATKDLRGERDPVRRQVGILAALHHVMRVSAGLEIATVLGALPGEPERFDARLGAVLAHFERAREG